MFLFAICIYLYAGITCAWSLWQLEGIGMGLNEFSTKKLTEPVLRKRPTVMIVIVLIWPIIFPYQAFTGIK